jgi:hypothetical protein
MISRGRGRIAVIFPEEYAFDSPEVKAVRKVSIALLLACFLLTAVARRKPSGHVNGGSSRDKAELAEETSFTHSCGAFFMRQLQGWGKLSHYEIPDAENIQAWRPRPVEFRGWLGQRSHHQEAYF